MFNNTFLEEAVANKNKRQQLDHLLRITAPRERAILSAICLVLLAFVAWALFGNITRVVSIDGVMLKPGVRHEIVTTEPGYLVEYLIAPGELVKVGDPVARQSVPELNREAAALRDRVELLDAQINEGGADGGALDSLLDSAQVALLQIEARRSAREMIVSQIEGEIMALRSAPGEYLPRGAPVALLREADDSSLQAVLRATAQQARRIQPGMRASVEAVMPDGVRQQYDGEVASVSAGPLPNWLATLQPAVPDSMHRVDIVIQHGADFSIPAGTTCQISIVLEKHPPAALFYR